MNATYEMGISCETTATINKKRSMGSCGRVQQSLLSIFVDTYWIRKVTDTLQIQSRQVQTESVQSFGFVIIDFHNAKIYYLRLAEQKPSQRPKLAVLAPIFMYQDMAPKSFLGSLSESLISTHAHKNKFILEFFQFSQNHHKKTPKNSTP